MRWKWSWPTPRLRMRELLGLVALIGLGLGLAREYGSPTRIWRRAARGNDPQRHREAWDQASRGVIPGLSIEETLEELVDATGDDDPMVRSQALYWLSQREKNPRGRLPLYVERLGDPSIMVRYVALEAVRDAVRTSSSGRDLVAPALLALIDDPDPSTRKYVVEALAEVAWQAGMGEKDPLLDAVARKLDDPVDMVWLEAALLLAGSARVDRALPKLEAFLIADRARLDDTGTAEKTLARIADRSDEAMEFLLREVYHKGQGVLVRFLFALGATEGLARQRVVALALKALEGEDEDLRVGAAFFLDSIESSSRRNPSRQYDDILRPTWLWALHHADAKVRLRAVDALRRPSRQDRSIRDALRSVRDHDPDPDVRQAAKEAVFVPEGSYEALEVP